MGKTTLKFEVHSVNKSDTLIVIERYNAKYYGYRLCPKGETDMKLMFSGGCATCIGFDSKKSALESALFHLSQNTFHPLRARSIELAFEICSENYKSDLRRYIIWQNYFAANRYAGVSEDESRNRADMKLLPDTSEHFGPEEMALYFGK